jgi:hypothetical protein
MKRLLLTLALLLTAACGAPSAPTATPAPAETVNPPISTPSQVTLLLSDPFTEQDVKVTFDLPEGWQITAGLEQHAHRRHPDSQTAWRRQPCACRIGQCARRHGS